MIISVMVLNSPLIFSNAETLTQVPGTDLFHILSLGVHSQILTIEVAK